MDIPLVLSGNFMEPRSNHFHSGLDIKTGGVEGVPIKSVADGWVSRIKVSPWGYGNALYIDHGNGYTSVYGHLQSYQGDIATYVLDSQYRSKDFSIDVYPEKGALPVKAGQVVALSGNSGGSGGPHLHFEIRRNSDQNALDPESYGIDLPDRTAPQIVGVRLYPLSDSTRVSPYPGTAKGFAAQGSGGRYALKPGEVPAAYGTVGFALHAFDKYDNSSNKCGVRRIELVVDSVPLFTVLLDHVDFDDNRYCNAHMDFALFKANSMDYHRCYTLPNNALDIYGKEAAQGRFTPVPGRTHKVLFRTTDANGNVSTLEFVLKGATLSEAALWPAPPKVLNVLHWDQDNILEQPGMRFTLKAKAIYEDLPLQYERRPAPKGALAPEHVLQDELTPLHATSTLSIQVEELPEHLRSKALIVKVEGPGKVSGLGGSYANGSVSHGIRAFGSYTVMLDTVPPTIVAEDLRSDMRGRTSFSLKVSDDLSGVDSFSATLDGTWILLSYDPKHRRLTHRFDDRSSGSGTRALEVVVKDDRGNRKTFTYSFTR